MANPANAANLANEMLSNRREGMAPVIKIEEKLQQPRHALLEYYKYCSRLVVVIVCPTLLDATASKKANPPRQVRAPRGVQSTGEPDAVA